ncbi:Gar1/Naf1 RNA binding region-domain-containing protein [Triangularia setosa]|uniref:H/ACA ribonucleoprotein complex non-core subunit NAF1 n=1 Tax=Triangularia setosa TaxID=2587417 RepID=A0AAN6W489_9PEZI|nr:Gar1/Naf1 RNA binding region-domain-containing protein [Podospora setosa]
MEGSTTQIPGLNLGQAQHDEKLAIDISQDTPLAVSFAPENATGQPADIAPQSEKQQENASQVVEASAHSGEGMDIDIQEPAVNNQTEPSTKHDLSGDVDMKATTLDVPGSPDITDALEAALAAESEVKNMVLATTQETTVAIEAALTAESDANVKGTVMAREQETVVPETATDAPNETARQGAEEEEGEHPEWEVDSSPYESSDSSSSDSSDDDSDDEDYPILGVEETARMLMALDHDGDGSGSRAVAEPIRSKNEKPEEVIPKPDVQILPEDKIELLGQVLFIVETNLVIKSSKSAAEQVLDTGTVLCKEDRTVIGALADVLGNVRDPMYTVGFTKAEEIKELGLEVGMSIFFPTKHANSVFTKPLMEVKYTDASNIHDEEVPPEEMEFSDDEKEAEYKRRQKEQKRMTREKRLGIEPGAGRGGSRGGKFGRGGGLGRGAQHAPSPSVATTATLDYDDDDGPYRPLTRPPGFGLPPKPPSPSRDQPSFSQRGSFRGDYDNRNRDDTRGRDGFRDRGNGRGRGNFRDRGNRGNFRGRDNEGGSRGFGHGRQSSVTTDASTATSATLPAFSPGVAPSPYNSHIPPPFPPGPPTAQGTWPAVPPIPFPPPPHGYSGAQQPPRPPIPGQPQPPTGGFTFNYPAWPQAQTQPQGQQYAYPQAAPPPPPPQQQQSAGYSQPPPVPPPNWAGAAAILQNLAQGAYGQQTQQQQAQQQTVQQSYQGQPVYPPQHGYQGQAGYQAQQQQQYSTQQQQGQQNGAAQQPQQQSQQQYWQR